MTFSADDVGSPPEKAIRRKMKVSELKKYMRENDKETNIKIPVDIP